MADKSSNCNPCDQVYKTESVASWLDNLTTQLFGEITKVVENGRAVWTTPCDLDTTILSYPRLPNEGLVCYLIRVVNNLVTGQSQALTIRETTGPTTLTETDTVLICKPATDIQVTLPRQADIAEGKVFEVHLDADYNVTVAPDNDTINGASNFIIDTEGSTLRFINTKTGDWKIL